MNPDPGGLIPDRTGEEVLAGRGGAFSTDILDAAGRIVSDVRRRRETALLEHAERLGDLEPGGPLIRTPEACAAALEGLERTARDVLARTAGRIESFARDQLSTITALDATVPGGRAGHRLVALRRAGCYAPGGRFSLPSSVLMTAVPARVAGVHSVWIASPRPSPEALAAAALAGADGVLAVGGAQAIAALAFGVGGPPPSDIVVGPGNRWVTAAKAVVSRRVRIDMLAGPSELLIVAGSDADPAWVAADLIAQAEHDPEAKPWLIVDDAATASRVRDQIARQLDGLATAPIAAEALAGGATLYVDRLADAVKLADEIAPEHLQLHGAAAERLADRFREYGALFIGAATPEVAGDYGAGPNHTLPTGGTARYASGLSVDTFLKRPTWLEMTPTDPGHDEVLADTAALARMEGLEGHARAAELRLRNVSAEMSAAP